MTLQEVLRAKAHEIAPRLTELRRHLHANPELSLKEYRTANFVAEHLRSLGLEPKIVAGGTGVCAVVEGGRPGARTVALRADMDALPIQETTGLPYASRNSGVMHACGHDGHTANLLGAAELLLAAREHFAGRVKLIFQPAEEVLAGAKRMIEEGALENPRVDAIFALHAWPKLAVGTIAHRSGPALAASNAFTITVTGCGTHAAYPERGRNPISALARLVHDLEAIPATRLGVGAPSVVSVAGFSSGSSAVNVIPESGTIIGTFRTLSETARAMVREEVLARTRAIECLGYAARVDFSEGCPVTVNHPSLDRLVARAIPAQLGSERFASLSETTMGAEDFAYYGARVPSCFLRLGVGERLSLHHPGFDFNDEALPSGMQAFARLAIEFLAEG